MTKNKKTKYIKSQGENVMEDVMTSSHHFGDNRSVYEEASSIKLKLQAKGFGY